MTHSLDLRPVGCLVSMTYLPFDVSLTTDVVVFGVVLIVVVFVLDVVMVLARI